MDGDRDEYMNETVGDGFPVPNRMNNGRGNPAPTAIGYVPCRGGCITGQQNHVNRISGKSLCCEAGISPIFFYASIS